MKTHGLTLLLTAMLLLLAARCPAEETNHGIFKIKDGGHIFYDSPCWNRYQDKQDVPKRAEPMVFYNPTSYGVVITTKLGHVHIVQARETRIWKFDSIETIQFKGWNPQNTDAETTWISSFLKAFHADDESEAAEAGELLRQSNLRES